MMPDMHRSADHLRFRDLKLLRALATTGSLRRAAAVLGIGQPMLSRRLRQIEHALGVTLWTRNPRGLKATTSGERLLTWAEALINEFALAQADIQAVPSTPLRLGAHPDLAMVLVPRVLSALPRQRAAIDETTLPDLLAGLERGELDAVFANCPPDAAGSGALVLEQLFRQQLVIAAAPGFSVANSWTALSEAPWILTPARDGMLRRLLNAPFAARGLPAPTPAVETHNLAVALRLVTQGFGLSALPQVVVADAETAGRLRRINIKPAIVMPPASLLYRRAGANHPRTRAIIAAVRAAVNELIASDKNLRRLS